MTAKTPLKPAHGKPYLQMSPWVYEKVGGVRVEGRRSADQSVFLPPDLLPGDYTLSVEVPPWKLDGREFGRGATLRAPVKLEAPASQ